MDLNLDHIINSVGAGRQTAVKHPLSQSSSQQLRRWWVAERSAPVLLTYQQHLLSQVIAEINRLRDHIETSSLVLLDETQDSMLQNQADVKIQLLLIETELERLKFIARAYIRTRIAKIDQFRYFYLQMQDEAVGSGASGLMSKDEWIYCHHHAQLLASHYGQSFLNKFPVEFQDLAEMNDQVAMIEQPDFDQLITFRVKNERTAMVGEEPVELRENNIYLMRYSAIADMLDDVEII